MLTLNPTGQGAGNLASLTQTGPPNPVATPIAYTGIEDLALVVQAVDGDGIRIAGTANNDTFEVTPGVTPDAGSVNGTFGVGAVPFTLPNVTYSGNTIATGAVVGLPATVGALGINTGDQGGVDTVVYNGTSENDIFTVSNEGVTLQSAAWGGPPAPPVLFGSFTDTSTTNIAINAGNGDDQITIVSATAGTETYDFNGGNPDNGSDVLNLVDPGVLQNVIILPDPVDSTQQDVTGYSANATPIDVTGIELITYTGVPAAGGGRDDNLVVETGPGADNIRVEDQTAGVTARVSSQRMPDIDFTGLTTFTLGQNPNGDPGAVTATFVTQNLDPLTIYSLNGLSEDVLVVEGADSFPDIFTISNFGIAATAVLVTDTTAALGPVQVSNVPIGAFRPGEVRINTLAGDDTLIVQTGGLGLFDVNLINTRIIYDGGTGGDVLNVIGTPATAITAAVYTTGPDPKSGKFDFGTAASPADLTGQTLTGTMQIEFFNLEPVNSSVPIPTLVVNGTNANDTIRYTAGPTAAASIFGGSVAGTVSNGLNELINFNAAANLAINAMAGNDTVLFENTGVSATPFVPAAIPPLAPFGLTGLIQVNGGPGNDVIDGSGNQTFTPFSIYGDAGNDTLTGGLGNDFVYGGTGDDLLVNTGGSDTYDGAQFSAAVVAPNLPLPAAIPDLVLPGFLPAGNDTLLFRGTAGNDIMAANQLAPNGTPFIGLNYQQLTASPLGTGVALPLEANRIATRLATATGTPATSTIEEVRLDGDAGNDIIQVAHADVFTAPAGPAPPLLRQRPD